MITRRKAIKKIGVLGGAAAIAPSVLGCDDRVRATGGGPPAGGGAGGDGEPSGPPITHVILVCMENRSYDHYFGARSLLEGKPGDGLRADMANPSAAGAPALVHRSTINCVPDPPHSWSASHMQFDLGANDGFYRAYQNAHSGAEPHVLGYQTREELPISWALADGYTTFDRWFASVMGPTWPNRMFWMSGQSSGLTANTFPPSGQFDWPSVFHRAVERGVDWGYYFSDLPALALVKGLSDAPNVRRMQEFFDAARAGTLPPVTYIDPAFGANDDHPPHHPILGQMFLLGIYKALAASPLWSRTMLVVTYDEHGGFFDHVAPPRTEDDRAAQGFDQLGFRVPAMAIGPYVREGVVSSTVHDHTSALKHLETMFGWAPLTKRVTAATDLSDALDADRLAARAPRQAAEVPALMVDESMIDDACFKRKSARTDLELAMDAGLLPRHLDRRPHLRDTLHDLGAELDRLGAGRLVRRRDGRLWTVE